MVVKIAQHNHLPRYQLGYIMKYFGVKYLGNTAFEMDKSDYSEFKNLLWQLSRSKECKQDELTWFVDSKEVSWPDALDACIWCAWEGK